LDLLGPWRDDPWLRRVANDALGATRCLRRCLWSLRFRLRGAALFLRRDHLLARRLSLGLLLLAHQLTLRLGRLAHALALRLGLSLSAGTHAG
jgi:hypothetical protein